MAEKKKKHLDELLEDDQEPFHLNHYIADLRSQMGCSDLRLKKRKSESFSISGNSVPPGFFSCESSCFFTHYKSPDPRNSPLFELPSPAKKKNRDGRVFHQIPVRTPAILLEAAARIQKQQPEKANKTNNKARTRGNGFGMVGSVLSRKQKPDVSIMLLLLCVLTLCLAVGVSTSTPVLTINSPDGDIIDCVNREDQPAFRHPMLKNHKLQEPPTSDLPYMVQKETDYIWQVWHQNGTKCPEGSIPIRRLIHHQNGTSGSNAGDRVTKGHEYATGVMKSQPKIYGTQATMNIWHPKIEGPEEFSLGQIWFTSGSYNTNDVNSIEAGWQVYPKLYHDYQPRFFIYWTTDAYNQTGGYNLRTGGFVQTSKTIAVEGAIAQTSIFGGIQVEVTIRMWKDQKLGSWWLGVILDGVLEPIGYWPVSLFTLQIDYATKVEWGGEIINTKPFGRHTTTQMGSGCFPDSGLGKVAYMRNLQIALSENDFQPLQDLEVGATHPDYYRAKKVNSTHFYYGGPEQLKSIAADLTFDYIILYLSFSLFLLI